VQRPQGESTKAAKVIKRSSNDDSDIQGSYNGNPILNTLDDIEFLDGEVLEYNAYVIAKNMYAQVDADGFAHTMLDSITDHSRDVTAVPKADRYVVTQRGLKRERKTTVRWMVNVLWRVGSEQWIPLSIMKNSHLLETDEYEVSQEIEIDEEPAFAW